jgi:hypothetical protein
LKERLTCLTNVRGLVLLIGRSVKMSIRGDRFKQVAHDVLRHIEDYTIPRYKDSPHDRLEQTSPVECVHDAEKYSARVQSPERYKGERKEDCLKAIQYWGEAYLKMIELENE